MLNQRYYPKVFVKEVRVVYHKARDFVSVYRKPLAASVLITGSSAMLGTGRAYASVPTLDVDPSGIIEAANAYIPMWTSILSTPAGLMIAFAIVSLVVGAIIAAFTKVKGMW